MRKDIEIPGKAQGVHIAAVRQPNPEYKLEEWNAYIINEQDETLDLVLIVSRGEKDGTKSSTMRHKLEKLPPKSFAKVEFIEDKLLALDNTFSVTFFLDGKLFEQEFNFPASTLKEENRNEIPLMPETGILAKMT